MPIGRPLEIPAAGDATQRHREEDVAAIIFVGANGSGKSRLGEWIERHQTAREVHRISAQRALTFSDNITQKAILAAERELYYGHETYTQSSQKWGQRWGGKPTSHLLNDYNAVLSLLYAKERKRDSEVVKDIRDGTTHSVATIPESGLDVLKRIWRAIFPHRELITANDTIKAALPNGDPYEGSAMSDGERVAIYLIGECLCAPPDSIVIVDEPEIHLHRSVQGDIWDEVESARPDCTFVYITHDLEFAAERAYAKKIWVNQFDGKNWDWLEVPADEDLPQDLVLQILGTRKPVLFVEGEVGSEDEVYRYLYPDHVIIHSGGCTHVIRSVRSMSEPGIFSSRTAFGLIDRDRRSDEELAALEREHIYSCPVAEVENLLCLPEILQAAAQTLHSPNKAQAAIDFTITEFAKEIERHAVSFAYRELCFQVGRFEEDKSWSAADLESAFTNHVASLDVPAKIASERIRFGKLVSDRDYIGILRVFNRKGLVNQLAGVLGLKPPVFRTWLFGQLESERRDNVNDGLLAAIRGNLPTIPTR